MPEDPQVRLVFTLTASLALMMLLGAVAAVLAVPLASRKVNALFLLTGFFIVLSPLSGADLENASTVLKAARIFVTILIILVAMLRFNIQSLGPSVKAMVPFLVLTSVSPAWSTVPLTGFLYVWFFTTAFVAGVLLAYGVDGREETARGFRFFVVVSAVLAILAMWLAGGGIAAQGRFNGLEIGPNRIAANAAILLLFATHIGLYDRSYAWRVFGAGVAALLATVIVITGCRAAAVMVMVGFLIQALPLTLRPGRLLLVSLFVTVTIVAIMSHFSGNQSLVRLANIENTRESMFDSNWDVFWRSPVIGSGCVLDISTLRRGNVHSMYFQVLLETGIVGAITLGVGLILVIYHGWRAYRFMRTRNSYSQLATIVPGMLAAILLLGLVESSPLMGSSLDTLFFGFCVGLIDRLPFVATVEARQNLLRRRLASSQAPG